MQSKAFFDPINNTFTFAAWNAKGEQLAFKSGFKTRAEALAWGKEQPSCKKP